MSDVDTTLMLFAAATASRTTESWQWVSWNSSGSVVDLPACWLPSHLCSLLLSSTAAETPATELLRSSVSHARQLTFAPRTPAPHRKQLSHTSAPALVGYGGTVSGKGANVEYQLRWRCGLQPRPPLNILCRNALPFGRYIIVYRYFPISKPTINEIWKKWRYLRQI